MALMQFANPKSRIGKDAVEAELKFIDPAGGVPVTYAYKPPARTPQRSGTYVSQQVSVFNGRNIGRATSLDREAFIIRQHQSRVTDFSDESVIRQVYYPEVAELVKTQTGASSVLVFDHTVRTTAPGGLERNELNEPVMVMHNDYTLQSAPRRVRELLSPEQAAQMLQHRVAEFNVWRPIRGPLQTKPLAVCDAASMKPSDFLRGERRYPDRVGEFFAIAYNARKRWHYFPDMLPSEALLIKCYDSDKSRAQFGAHEAFDDPTTPTNALPRESIETRAFAFFSPSVLPSPKQ
jgi:hypothetical protein